MTTTPRPREAIENRETLAMTTQTFDALPDDTLLPRASLADALTACGVPITKLTLATKATRGGGPPYSLLGKRAIYRWGDAVAWARGGMSVPATTSSAHRR